MSENHEPVSSPIKQILAITALVLSCLFGLSAYLFWPKAMKYYLLSRMDPKTRAEFIEYDSKPVSFPETWAIVDPWDPAVLRQLNALIMDYDKHRTVKPGTGRRIAPEKALAEKLHQRMSLSADEVTTLAELIKDHGSWALEVARVARDPGFEMEMLSTSVFPHGAPDDSYTAFVAAARYLSLLAYHKQRSGEKGEALSLGLQLMHMAQRHEASSMMSHLIAVALLSSGSTVLRNVSLTCEDPELLRPVLKDLNSSATALNPLVLTSATLLEEVATLRSAARIGHKVDLEDGWPEDYYSAQWQNLLYGSGATSNYNDPESRLKRMILFNVGRPDVLVASTREKRAQVEYDLARLAIARRIAKLEKLPGAERDASALVPVLFLELPKDSFTNSTYHWDPKTGIDYSVGPDLRDDHAAVGYDPTNGTLSAGDIF